MIRYLIWKLEEQLTSLTIDILKKKNSLKGSKKANRWRIVDNIEDIYRGDFVESWNYEKLTLWKVIRWRIVDIIESWLCWKLTLWKTLWKVIRWWTVDFIERALYVVLKPDKYLDTHCTNFQCWWWGWFWIMKMVDMNIEMMIMHMIDAFI